MRLILIRHAETAHNRDNRVQGRADNPLSELGVQQAAALGAALRGQTLATIVASPLQRALDTARVVAQETGAPLETDPALEEMHVGELEGLAIAEMRERYPEFLSEWVTERGASIPMPGGESLDQVKQRAWAVVERLRGRFEDQTAAIVSHNFVLGTLITTALGMPLHNFRRFRLGVCSMTVLRFRADRTLLLSLNDQCHLARAGLAAATHWPAPPPRAAQA